MRLRWAPCDYRKIRSQTLTRGPVIKTGATAARFCHMITFGKYANPTTTTVATTICAANPALILAWKGLGRKNYRLLATST